MMSAITSIDAGVDILLDLAGHHPIGHNDDNVESLRNEYVQRRENKIPRVMLFGAYNAGKSSLINALVGSESAAYSDSPETSKAKEYRWGDCVLIDTPGVNAPIEHEEITELEIKRSELILLVVRQGEVDAADVYERLFGLVNQEKKIFIVFNHESSSEALPELIAHLNSTLELEADRRSVDLGKISNIQIYPVNIATANRARLTCKYALLNHSGLVDFEQAFYGWLAEFDDEEHFVEHLRRYVEQRLVQPIAAVIGSGDDSETKAEIEHLNIKRESIRQWYETRRMELKSLVRWKITDRKNEIRSALEASGSIKAAEPELYGIYRKVYEDVCASEQLETFIDRMKEVETSELPHLANEFSGIEGDDGSDGLSETLANSLKTLDEQALFSTLKRLKDVGVPVLKDMAEETVKKYAKRVNFVLNLAYTGFEVYRAGEKQNQENDRRRQEIMAMHQAVESISGGFQNALVEALDKMVQPLEVKELAAIDKKKDEIVNQLGAAKADRAAFETALSKIRPIDHARPGPPVG